MSRIGRAPIPVPSGVEVTLEPGFARVKGPKGTLERTLPRAMKVERQGDEILVTRPSDDGPHRSLHGLTRTLIANMIQGVTEGFSKNLEIHGVGYRAAAKGNGLEIQVGYSHPVEYPAPEGITFEVSTPTRITVRGADKEMVGQVAAEIRSVRKPDPYKQKGIRYEGEYIRKKAGKTAK
ncbi:MAG TPA: 50S ribosomal protein L6 [Actinomycetota bacterium]|nr:50S ribosomal protein L6 [Actinomycetota bacterium]